MLSSRPSPRSGRESRRASVDDAARTALGRYGLEEAFGHGTGHGLGLEVHEEPRIGRPLAGQPDLVLAARDGVHDRAGRLRRRHRRRADRRRCARDRRGVRGSDGQRRVIGVRRHRADPGADATARPVRVRAGAGRVEAQGPQNEYGLCAGRGAGPRPPLFLRRGPPVAGLGRPRHRCSRRRRRRSTSRPWTWRS